MTLDSSRVFDFGLSTAEEERARRLQTESIIVDMVHQGGAGQAFFDRPELKAERDILNSGEIDDPVDFLRMAKRLSYSADLKGTGSFMRQVWDDSGVTVGSGAVEVRRGEPQERTSSAFTNHLMNTLPWLDRALTAKDIRETKRQGKHALYGYFQPVYDLPKELWKYEEAYFYGLRMLMLTYNTSNGVGCGCIERVDHGITKFGAKLVDFCNETGIVVDTSHCGHETTMDACKLSKRPVSANHTAARAVHWHERGKEDDALKAIAGTGGLIGIVAVPFFVSGSNRPSINDMLDHIDHVVRTVGWQHVGIGTDWPLSGPTEGLEKSYEKGLAKIGFNSKQHGSTTMRLEGFADYSEFPNITRGLVKRGHSDEAIRGILGENFLRVFESVCG
jgi:membrane dipeptidase